MPYGFKGFAQTLVNHWGGGWIDTFDSLLPRWTARLGTVTVSGGFLQALAMDDIGANLITNGADWTGGPPPTGWVQRSTAILTAVAGGESGNCLQAENGAAAYGYASQEPIPVLLGASYAGNVWHLNGTKKGDLFLGTAIGGSQYQNSQNLTAIAWTRFRIDPFETITATLFISLRTHSSGLADTTFWDTCSLYRQNAIATVDSPANGIIVAGVQMPAADTTPRSIIARYADVNNYWEIRITPNTAGNDLELIEVNAGTATVRANADIDWTANAVDDVRVALSGATIAVYHRKSGQSSWAQGCTYGSAALNQTTACHGLVLWGGLENTFGYFGFD